MNELTPLEKEIVKSAHGDGMIPFPQGSFLAVERTFRMLDSLARRGYVEYVAKTWYRAYWITESFAEVRSCDAKCRPALGV